MFFYTESELCGSESFQWLVVAMECLSVFTVAAHCGVLFATFRWLVSGEECLQQKCTLQTLRVRFVAGCVFLLIGGFDTGVNLLQQLVFAEGDLCTKWVFSGVCFLDHRVDRAYTD